MALTKADKNRLLRCDRDDITRLRDAASWILKLNGAQYPQAQEELRAELARAEDALARIRAAIPPAAKQFSPWDAPPLQAELKRRLWSVFDAAKALVDRETPAAWETVIRALALVPEAEKPQTIAQSQLRTGPTVQ